MAQEEKTNNVRRYYNLKGTEDKEEEEQHQNDGLVLRGLQTLQTFGFIEKLDDDTNSTTNSTSSSDDSSSDDNDSSSSEDSSSSGGSSDDPVSVDSVDSTDASADNDIGGTITISDESGGAAVLVSCFVLPTHHSIITLSLNEQFSKILYSFFFQKFIVKLLLIFWIFFLSLLLT